MTHGLRVKSMDMLAIEQAFANLKQHSDTNGNLTNIQRILQRHFDLQFTISIVENKTNQFFGMTIFPARNVIDTMIDHIVNKKSKSDVIEELWTKNKSWHLEIDSILLYDTNLNANPAEMTAILLHEIGHVVHSNTIPARVNKVMRYELMNLSFNLKKLVTWRKAQRLFDLVLIEAVSSKNYHTTLNKEIDADKFVVKMGYQNNLADFIDKLIATQGNRLVDRTEKDMEKDIRGVVIWTLENIAELEFRKTKLRTTLQTELLQNPSRYVRGVVYDLKAKFFGGGDDDNYREMITEQYLVQEHKKVVQEGLLDLFDKLGKVKKITQSDIDIIQVELGRVQNEDDRIYVLDLIYDKLDRINAALEYIAKKQPDKVSVPKDRLISYKTQLEKLRKDVLAVHIKPKDYGVFVNYPKGYEG